ncbi:CLIP domain-containing serine protease B9 [Papilio machaon]|uniref:CLIP domain-containing serine protease B9 n=1 Tax=Papilio machaon TaxID=76193 RepID=UPI001E662A64|nr:CLIP domain-containing serine protease B9 [Papilio machaon]
MTQISANCMWLVVLVAGSFRTTLSMKYQCQQKNKECTIITNCTSALEALKNREDKLLRMMHCGYDVRGPRVCCPVDRPIVFRNDSETATSRVETTSTTQNPATTPLITTSTSASNVLNTANVLPSIKVCGISGSGLDRIIGGSIAALDEFPWLARIATKRYDKLKYTCGGSLITQQFVVSAAHCVIDRKVVAVRLGEWDTETEKDCNDDDYCSDPPVDVMVVQVIVHPMYDRRLHNGDISLLRLEKSINYTDFIRPVCLPTTEFVASQDYVIGTSFTTAGWGLTELGTPSIIKQKVDLDTVPMDICKVKMPHINKLDVDKIICAGGKPGKDTCNGDSGGPLTKDITIEFNTNAYLFGITSFGSARCGVTDTPSVYTRVAAYMDWIIANINK